MKIKGFFKGLWSKITQIFKPKSKKEKPVSRTKPARDVTYVEPEDPEERQAEIELERIKDMIEAAEFGDFSPSATLMILSSCERLNDIIGDAEKRMSALDIMDRLKSLYGGRLEGLTQMIDSLIYAVYNKNNSGFAKWAGRGARARWEAEIKRIEEALS